MTEQYAFIVNNQTLTFADLKSNYGLILKNIVQSASVSWNIATSKNPYQDGDQVNNRTANSREMVIEFEYSLSTEPTLANAFLFPFLATGENGAITVKKTLNGVNKYINGTIREITQDVYTENPILQIVLLTEPYWYGEQIILDFSDPLVGEIALSAGFVEGFKFKGEAQMGFSVYLQFYSNPNEFSAYLSGNIFGNYFRVDYTAKKLPYTIENPMLPGRAVDMIQPTISMKKQFKAIIDEYANVSSSFPVYVLNHSTNIINGLDENTKMARIYPNRTDIGQINFDATTAAALTSNPPTAKLLFSYTPLYIR